MQDVASSKNEVMIAPAPRTSGANLFPVAPDAE